MKTINYALVDIGGFWSIMNYLDAYISDGYYLQESENPDYLICSVFGKSVMKEDAIRIQYIGENLEPDFNVYDYAIGFHFLDFGDRYLRYPIYAFAYRDAFLKALEKHKCLEQELRSKDKFCSFVVSNGHAEDVRTQFFMKLSQYKRVESGGRFMNNVGCFLKGVEAKTEFQRKCRFAIAFENSSMPGYTTEKLLQAWQADTIPIYWGNPEIGKEFNTKAFINCHEYENFEQVIERIIEIDNDEELYMKIMREPILYEGCIAEQYVSGECLKNFLGRIFSGEKEEMYRRSSYHSQFGKNYAALQRGETRIQRVINKLHF